MVYAFTLATLLLSLGGTVDGCLRTKDGEDGVLTTTVPTTTVAMTSTTATTTTATIAPFGCPDLPKFLPLDCPQGEGSCNFNLDRTTRTLHNGEAACVIFCQNENDDLWFEGIDGLPQKSRSGNIDGSSTGFYAAHITETDVPVGEARKIVCAASTRNCQCRKFFDESEMIKCEGADCPPPQWMHYSYKAEEDECELSMFCDGQTTSVQVAGNSMEKTDVVYCLNNKLVEVSGIIPLEPIRYRCSAR